MVARATTIALGLIFLSVGAIMFVVSIFFNSLFDVIVFGDAAQATVGFIAICLWWFTATAVTVLGVSCVGAVVKDFKRELEYLRKTVCDTIEL